MKMQFKYLSFLFALISAFSLKLNVKVQTAAYDSIINGNLQFYAGLDKTEMESDYLFNKGFIVLEDMEKWYSGIPIMSKPWKWRYIYAAVSSSCLSNCLGFPAYDSLVSFNNVDRFGTSTINLACLNINGDYITQSNIIEHAESNEDIEFESFTFFSGSALHSKSYSSNVEFYWDSKNYFSNYSGTESLSINFGDNLGWHVLPKNNSEIFNVFYSCIGDKNIAFRLINGIDTTYSYSSITVLHSQPIIPTAVDTISVFVEDSTDNSQSRMAIPGNGNILVSGEYVYFQGYDGKLDKPVIFIEGFDIAGDQNSFTLIGETHLIALLNNGYDVFYLSFINSGRSLLENALIVKELIKYINDNKVDYFEGILLGESMGGILGRIALKQLENEGYDHQIGLFVANDSPMKGANIPLGLQWMVNDVLLSFGYQMVFQTAFAELLEAIFNEDIFILDILDQLGSPAARQMIIRHYMGNSDYLFMQAYLDLLGYPENCRNVCASSGGENIPENVISAFPNQHIVDFPPLYVGVFIVDFYCRYSGVNQNDYLVSQVAYANLFPPNFFNYIRRREDFNFQKFDSAPGGSEGDADFNIKFCFVPTSSSIGLETSLFNSAQGLELFNRNNENQLIANGSIPFDDVYLNKLNFNHRSGFNKIKELDSMEIMYDRMYLQNRTINGPLNFEASNLIEIGRNLRTQFHSLFNINSNTGLPIINLATGEPEENESVTINYNPDPYKKIDIGDFVTKSTSNVSVNSGKEIKLMPGTTFEIGSEVKLFITDNPNLERISVIKDNYLPEVKYSSCSLFCRVPDVPTNSRISWTISNSKINKTLIGNNISLQIGDWGQYFITCSLNSNNNIFEKSFTIRVEDYCRAKQNNSIRYNSPIMLYPNPSSNLVNIELLDLDDQLISYEITSSDGRIVISEYFNSKVIDISSLSTGIYFISIKTSKTVHFEKFTKI